MQELVAANDKLSVRAAVSYTELTPRYEKFGGFFSEFDMEFYKGKKGKRRQS